MPVRGVAGAYGEAYALKDEDGGRTLNLWFRGRSSVGRAPPLHGGGQGFESPRLHLKSSIIFPGNRKQDKRDGVQELPILWQETPLTELLRRVLGVSLF